MVEGVLPNSFLGSTSNLVVEVMLLKVNGGRYVVSKQRKPIKQVSDSSYEYYSHPFMT